jgi:hypothetical protein
MSRNLPMSDMGSLTTILLAEACVILLVVLVTMIWMQIKAKSKLRKAVGQLVSQIKQQSKARKEENGSFLRRSYDLTDGELVSTVEAIDKQERKFFQEMVDVLSRSDPAKITSLDASVAELINTYKGLKPKSAKDNSGEASEDSLAKIARLQSEKENLARELEITRETMSNMIKEYSSMFGGGKDHKPDNAVDGEKAITPAELDAVTSKAKTQTNLE